MSSLLYLLIFFKISLLKTPPPVSNTFELLLFIELFIW